MSSDLEASGALVSAARVAGEIEHSSLPQRDQTAAIKHCGNCDTELVGPYCHACGQAAHLHRSLLALIEEVLHRIVHLEAKSWRTLPLLSLRPGLLTRRYIEGQRTRYISPLSLFLFNTFLMFFVFSLTLSTGPSKPLSAAQRAQLNAELAQARFEGNAEVARAEAALARAQARGTQISEAASELALAKAAARISSAAATTATGISSATQTPLRVSGSSSMALMSTVLPNLDVHTGVSALDARLHRELSNPELFVYKLRNTAYKFSFMLIPISLPFLWLLFIGRPGVRMYDHAVFSLYSLSFMWLLFSIVALLAAAGGGALAAAIVWTIPPLHMFAQLRGTYRLSVIAALWRTAALVCVAGTAFVIFLLTIALLTLH